ncbi:hypothetical protein DFJ73DRAFT_49363 [Zopfochytrium polystomum]|nr:hypothetical protein DFJ73DRAFT_49363 [Zopfochytrium polystomum]
MHLASLAAAAVAAAVAALVQPVEAATGFTAGGFNFYASIPNAGNALVCMSGPLAASNWVAIGFPADPNNPGMIGAEIVLAYPNTDSVANPVNLLHGAGTSSSGIQTFTRIPSTATDKEVVLSTENSSYRSGNIVACFIRPFNATSALVTGATFSPVNLTQTATSYIWATGPMTNGAPAKHTSNDVVTGASLFQAASTTTGSGTSSATTSSKSAATRPAAAGSSALVAGVLAAFAAAVVACVA